MTGLHRPLRFERVFIEKVWGGRALARTPGIELPPDVPVGETWEIVDRRDQNSVVRSGPLAGMRMEEVMDRYAEDLLGRAGANSRGRFPLLVKYIDATQNLSVQAHPDDAAAERIGGDSEGKTEAWYILESAPDGAIYCGLESGVDRERLAAAARGTGLVDLIQRHAAHAGESITVSGGTVHAIGAGVTLLEVQQNSNTTYRLYDWDRVGLDGKPRETHVDSALEAIDFDAPLQKPRAPRWEQVERGVERAVLSVTDYFSMRRLRLQASSGADTQGQFRIYVATAGSGTLSLPGAGSDTEWSLAPGDVLLLPAALGAHQLVPGADGMELIALDANA